MAQSISTVGGAVPAEGKVDNVIIIGGVAGGATAAARLRRLSESVRITIFDRGSYVSYANCGLPYYLSGDIENRGDLFVQTPEGFKKTYNVQVNLEAEVKQIDRQQKRVLARDKTGTETWHAYDKLILAQGGNAVFPPIPGFDSPKVFKLWRVPDMDAIDAYLREQHPASVVVMGGGFVGLEMVEAFKKRGLETAVVEMMPHVMGLMDKAFGLRVGQELEAHGVKVLTGVGVKAYHPNDSQVELSDGRRLPADLVLCSIGVRPELELAKQAGLTMGSTGSLAVNDRLQTSDPDIYAAGDMIEVVHKITGRQVRMPLAGPANRQGRIAASNAMGMDMRYKGALGTSVVQLFEATAASTGLSEKAAREAGFKVGVCEVVRGHHAGYYPGAQPVTLKLVYEKETARLLGAQAFGHAGVDKRIDALAMALHGNMTLHDLAEVDFCYAPPYSSANDHINIAAFVGLNDVSGFSPLATAAELKAALDQGQPLTVLDVRSPAEYEKGHVKGATNIPLDRLRTGWKALPTDRPIFVHCKVGYRGHLGTRILADSGFTAFQNVRNVTGGMNAIQAEGGIEVVSGL